MKNLKLEIVSTEKILFDGDCSMATIPSSLGEMGVMAGHEMFVTNLKQGVINIYDEKNAVIDLIEIKGGFAEMKNEKKLLVLVN